MRFFLRILLLLTLMMAGGFIVFVMSLPDPAAFDRSDSTARDGVFADGNVGIVALTGGGGARIQKALDIHANLNANRILISGTHPDVRKEELAVRFESDLFDCCVDLGPEAKTTIGNARETVAWVDENDFAGIYLVTHDYHLPRAMLELKNVAPDLNVIGVPVTRASDTPSWRLLAREYGKFLLALVRTVM